MVTINENVSFIDHAYEIPLPGGCELTINWKKDNDVTICQHNVIVKFFWRCRVALVKFSYWSMFDVNIPAGSGVMAIFVYIGLTRNPEIRNTSVCVLPSRDWCRVGIQNLARMSLTKSYWCYWCCKMPGL